MAAAPMAVPFIVKALPYVPAVVSALGSIFGFGSGKKQEKRQRQQFEMQRQGWDRNEAIRLALTNHFLDRNGLRARLPPALLNALLAARPYGQQFQGTPGLGTGLAAGLFNSLKYVPQFQNTFKGAGG